MHIHIWPKEQEMNWKGVLCSCVVLFSVLSITLLNADIDFILEFTGALAGTQLLIVIPMMLMWKTEKVLKVKL